MEELPGRPEDGGSQDPSLPAEPEQVCNPWYAVIFSGVVPGWGQWYTGRTLAGIAFYAGIFLFALLSMAARIFIIQLHPYDPSLMILSLMIFLGIWMYGMYDAYRSAQKINRQELGFTGKSLLFWFPALAMIITIAYMLLIVIIVAGVVISGAIIPGGGIQDDGFADMNVSATARQPDADHIVVTMQNVPDPDQIFEVYAKVTDDTNNTQTKVIGLDYSEVTAGRTMVFTGKYAESNHVTATVVFDDTRNVTEILDTYI